MNDIFTSSTFDAILNYLVKSIRLGDIEDFDIGNPLSVPSGVTFEAYGAILTDFKRKGLLEHLSFNGYDFDDYSISISISVDALRFHRLGGFTGQEELLKKTFEKLKLELEALKTSAPDIFERITNQMSSIGSIMQGIAAITS